MTDKKKRSENGTDSIEKDHVTIHPKIGIILCYLSSIGRYKKFVKLH